VFAALVKNNTKAIILIFIVCWNKLIGFSFKYQLFKGDWKLLFDGWSFTFDGWTHLCRKTIYICSMKKNYLDKFERYIAFIWGCTFIVFAIQFSNGSSMLEGICMSLTCSCITYPLTTYLSKSLLINAIRKRRFLIFIFQFIGLSVFSALLYIYFFEIFNYLEQIGVFPRSLIFEEDNGFWSNFIGSFYVAVLINFGFCGLRFFEENLKLQKTMIDSQLQILQAQINPHFMFNVLNHVNVLIKKEPELASNLLIQYTEILRYQLYTTRTEYVSLGQEVQFLINFIEIEKVRWKNNLDVECLWEVEDNEHQIPPLLLITFIENAFKHVSRSKKKKGYVKIELKQHKERVKLYVENSKFADKYNEDRKKDSGIGLSNIRKRLDILLPGKNEISISENETVYSTTLMIKT